MPRPDLPPLALVSYSTKPRGGVVHTLALGEALHRAGADVVVVGLGDPAVGFYRPADVRTLVVSAPEVAGDLELRVAANTDALELALAEIVAERPLLHTQDCIAARAAARVRDAGAACTVLRTVHHVDDFTSQVLMDCQRAAIDEPDGVFVVSETWRRILRTDYGVEAAVVPNGVDLARFGPPPPPGLVDALRERVGAVRKPLVLAVGGVEPRKGSDTLVAAMSRLKAERSPAPVLAIIGGHSFQDHRRYEETVLASLEPLGLDLGTDVIKVGTVPDAEMAAWYHAADVLAFPSVKEGFGLAVLEAMGAGLPVVTSDLPALQEWLVADRDALVVPVADPDALAEALALVLDDQSLRAGLVEHGRGLAERLSWDASARRHLDVYADWR